MTDTEIGTFTTGSTEWRIRFSSSSKWFYGTAPGYPEVIGNSWMAVTANAKMLYSQSRVRVSVPYCYMTWQDGKQVIQDGVATGIHGSNQHILATENGKSVQLDSGHFMKPLTDHEDRKALLAMTEAIRDLEKDRDEIMSRYRFGSGGLRGTVQDAIKKARNASKDDDQA